MPQAIRDGIIVVLVISGPLVLAAAFIGLVVGVLQAATQVQEQTIGSALKIIGVFGIIIFAGYWMFQYLNNYTSRTITTAFTFVPGQTQKAIPRGVKENINEGFEEKINAEVLAEPVVITPPKEIESTIPQAGLPQGFPYLGAPEVSKPPSVSKSTPIFPQAPTQAIKPNIPTLNFQEPMAFSMPILPKLPNNIQVPQDIPALQDNNTNGQTENVDMLQINLVPGESIKVNNVDTKEIVKESADIPSWLN